MTTASFGKKATLAEVSAYVHFVYNLNSALQIAFHEDVLGETGWMNLADTLEKHGYTYPRDPQTKHPKHIPQDLCVQLLKFFLTGEKDGNLGKVLAKAGIRPSKK